MRFEGKSLKRRRFSDHARGGVSNTIPARQERKTRRTEPWAAEGSEEKVNARAEHDSTRADSLSAVVSFTSAMHRRQRLLRNTTVGITILNAHSIRRDLCPCRRRLARTAAHIRRRLPPGALHERSCGYADSRTANDHRERPSATRFPLPSGRADTETPTFSCDSKLRLVAQPRAVFAAFFLDRNQRLIRSSCHSSTTSSSEKRSRHFVHNASSDPLHFRIKVRETSRKNLTTLDVSNSGIVIMKMTSCRGM
jgi:hypothetical protein